ncbi:hypothetical protein [Vibrio sinaloensis]|uniref:hypothetical protein n=1 Tax=Photobacterium sp. (strain ATCC 43367) TaxID=379097 RepID=UPI0022AF6664|nr:hypothetical protein [Vibrio sinaloensis]MCZ4292958.1 hypothetical protein [Vibrio sinaloensis]MDF4346817.1 hypothetical protein [Vibrio parahaemolyticus]
MPSHKNIHQAYIARDQEVLNAAAYVSLLNAYKILKKTSLFGKLNELKAYNEDFKRYQKTNGNITDNHIKLGDTMEAMKSCYNGISDDLLLLAAFEHLMCFKLLSKGYVIHQLKKPKNVVTDLKINEEKVSIHSLNGTATVDDFKEITLNGNALMKPSYISLLTSKQSEVSGLNSLKERRNKAHFDARIYCFSAHDEEFFAANQLIFDSVYTEAVKLYPDYIQAN